MITLEQLIESTIQKTASHLGQVVQPNVRRGMVTQIVSEIRSLHNTEFVAKSIVTPKPIVPSKGGTFLEDDIINDETKA